MHHSDQDIDASTAVRFHPLEIFISMIVKIVIVFILGAPVEAALAFEILLSSCALFNHSNIAIPAKLETKIRSILITPDVHRIHHSIKKQETDSNFGFSITWWDKIFNSWCENPEGGQAGLVTGLKEFPDNERMQLVELLLQPFKKE